jgi:hypothetical protein
LVVPAIKTTPITASETETACARTSFLFLAKKEQRNIKTLAKINILTQKSSVDEIIKCQ